MRLADRFEMPVGTANFLAGGFCAFSYWTFAMPADNIKSRVQGAPLQAPVSVSEAARTIYRETGFRGFYRGFGICMLRAFPTNASAFFVYEGLMRLLGAEKVCKDHITRGIHAETVPDTKIAELVDYGDVMGVPVADELEDEPPTMVAYEGLLGLLDVSLMSLAISARHSSEYSSCHVSVCSAMLSQSPSSRAWPGAQLFLEP